MCDKIAPFQAIVMAESKAALQNNSTSVPLVAMTCSLTAAPQPPASEMPNNHKKRRPLPIIFLSSFVVVLLVTCGVLAALYIAENKKSNKELERQPSGKQHKHFVKMNDNQVNRKIMIKSLIKCGSLVLRKTF